MLARSPVGSLAVAAAVACSPSCQSPTPRAQSGAAARAPDRIVTLTPSATELVAAIAGAHAIVATDKFSDYPAAVAALPKVGTFLAPNTELIVELAPHVVVLDAVQERVGHSLRRVGIKTVTLQMKSLADLKQGIHTLGVALARRQAAAAVLDRLEADLRAAARRSQGAKGRPRVLFVVDRQPGSLRGLVAAGPGSYLDELVTLAGGANVLADAHAQFPHISREVVLLRAPEIIVDGAVSEDRERAAADWSSLSPVPAVQAGRVHILRSDIPYNHPGPRLGLVVRQLAEVFFP